MADDPKEVTVTIPTNGKPLEVLLDVVCTFVAAYVAYLIAGALVPAAMAFGGLVPALLAFAAGYYAWKWFRSHQWIK